MKLQTRTALVPLITVSALCLGLYLLVNELTVRSFNQLETEILHKQVERVNSSISNLVSEHSSKIVDWAQWDNTYNFIESLEQGYIDENLNGLTLAALGFSSVLYLTPSLELRYGVTVVGEEVQKVDPSVVEQVREVLNTSTEAAFQGLANIGGEVFMLAASPILPNKGDQPARGLLVATAKITPELLDIVQYNTNLKLKFWQKDAFAADPVLRASGAALDRNLQAVIEHATPKRAYIFGTSKDYAGKPLLYFRVEDARQIVSSSVKVRDLSLAVLMTAGLFAVILLSAVIYVSASKRITRFSAQVRSIAGAGDSTGRLSDETVHSYSLKFRTAGGVLIVFVLLTAVTGSFLNRYFLRGFEEVENQVMSDNLERATRALKGRLEKIKGKVTDWAQWDDTYQFIEDHNAEYLEQNLGFDTLGPMNMKYVLFYDLKNNLVDGRDVRTAEENVVSVDTQTSAAVSAAPALSLAGEPVAGFLTVPAGTLLAAASPILDTSRSKPSRGSMIFATLADKALAAELGRQVRLDLHFAKITDAARLAPLSISRLSAEEIRGNAVILDVLGRPAMQAVVNSERPIYERGLLTAKFLPLYFVLGGIFCALATLVWVNRILLSRVRKLGEETSLIKESGEAIKRVTARGSDEISGLASDINSMLLALQKTEEELKIARLAADKANAAKSQFIARVSHELRTPIAGVIGLNAMILKRLNKDNSRAVCELVSMASQSAEGLLTIINEILDFSKAESGEITVEKIPFEIRPVIRETMQIIAARIAGRESSSAESPVELVCDVDTEVPRNLRGDPTKLKQILVNLLANAVKFTEKGYVGLRISGKLHENDGVHIKFDVWDTGIGIPQQKLAAVFEPFKQADETVTRQYQGTGLGLAIVKQFSEALGGTISLKSQVGEGSTFSVVIPFEANAAECASLRSPYASKVLPKSVLLVARPSASTESLQNGLDALGAKAERTAPFVQGNLSAFEAKLASSDLVILREEAFTDSDIFEVLKRKLVARGLCVIALVRPCNLELRERLYGIGVQHILSAPVMADDILLTYMGELGHAASGAGSEEDPLRFNKKLKILVADDVATNRIIIEDMLKEAGHTTVSASDGKKLVDLLTPMINGEAGCEHFDIVLTDISMPVMDGYEAARLVRELERESPGGGHVPIIAITAHILSEEQEKMRNAGIDGVLTKPIRAKAVAAEFSKLLSGSLT